MFSCSSENATHAASISIKCGSAAHDCTTQCYRHLDTWAPCTHSHHEGKEIWICPGWLRQISCYPCLRKDNCSLSVYNSPLCSGRKIIYIYLLRVECEIRQHFYIFVAPFSPLSFEQGMGRGFILFIQIHLLYPALLSRGDPKQFTLFWCSG